jgi:hypothetical protein
MMPLVQMWLQSSRYALPSIALAVATAVHLAQAAVRPDVLGKTTDMLYNNALMHLCTLARVCLNDLSASCKMCSYQEHLKGLPRRIRAVCSADKAHNCRRQQRQMQQHEDHN